MSKDVKQIFSNNICIFIIMISAAFMVIMNVHNTLFIIKRGGILNNVQYSLFYLKFDMTRDGYRYVREVFNYPLIPIGFGILYNSYSMFMKRNREKEVAS